MEAWRKGIIVPVLSLLLTVPTNINADNNVSSASVDFNLPPVKSLVLENGIRVYYIKSELPTITIAAAAGFGSLYEGKKNAGISELLAKSVSLGGSKKYPGNRLHQEIESIGGKFRISSSWENLVVSVKVLSRYREKAVDILSDIIKNPNFDEVSIETARSILIEQIKRRNDKPSDIGFVKVKELIFEGEGYGSVSRVRLMRSFRIKDLVDHWEKHINGDNIILGVSAASGFPETASLVKKFMSGVQKGIRISYNVNYLRLKSNVEKRSGDIYLIPKNIPQSTVIIGTFAPDVHYSGKYGLSVMNYILGGGSFNSRLVREIRVKKGYAYVAHSTLRNRGGSGVFLAYTQTKNENVDKVITIITENINRISTTPVTIKELEWAKNSYYNSFIFRFDTPMDIISNYIDLAYYGLSENYYNSYLENIKKVEAVYIQEEAKKLFNSGLVKLVVGPVSLKEKLSRFGKVVVLDEDDSN